MQKLKFFTHCILLATTPFLLASSEPSFSQIAPQTMNWLDEWLWIQPTTFDGIIEMLKDLESGELEKRFPTEQLEHMNEYLVTLAKEGALPNEFEEEAGLKEDAEDLICGENNTFELTRYMEKSNKYMITPAIFNGHSKNFVQCGKISKAWKKTKKFAKKHKKEIIIGAIIILAVTVVARAVVVKSSINSEPTDVGSAAESSDSGHLAPKEKPSSVYALSNEVLPLVDIEDMPMMKIAINEHVATFKEFLIEDEAVQTNTSYKGWDEMSFGEKAREVGAVIAHQTLDEVTDLVKVFPELCQEIKELGSKVLPDSLTSPNSRNTRASIENYENWIAKGHKAIDIAFSTDQAEYFTSEAKINDPMNNFAIGIIPFPGIFSGGKIDVKKLSEAGKAIDRGGFTKAGRNLMKHGYRKGSIFPKPLGTPAQINVHGQRVLESILNHPEKKLFPAEFDRYGKVIDIYAPGLGGARYNASGEFIGFLEL